MESDYHGPINIGNPGEFTIIELANQLKEMLASSSKLEYKPLPEGDPRMRKPDITKAREILHWEPKVSLADGLKSTIQWFQKQLSAQSEPLSAT